MSLLFISMVSGTGLFSLSNQEAYALDEEFVGDNSQYDEGCTNFVEVDCGAGTTDGETTTSGSQDTGGVSFIDEDGDDVEDAYDPCIDPNDQFNNCSVNTDGDSFPNQQDPCPDDPLDQCLDTQGMSNGVSNVDSQDSSSSEVSMPENAATEGAYQYDEGCTNFVEVDCGAGTTEEQATLTGASSEGQDETSGVGEYSFDSTTGEVQYDEGCTNFVEVDCSAGTTEEELTTTEGQTDGGDGATITEGNQFPDSDSDSVNDAAVNEITSTLGCSSPDIWSVNGGTYRKGPWSFDYQIINGQDWY